MMEKKAKKRLEVLRQKSEKQQKLIAAAQAQQDEPGELEALKKQLVAIQAEIDKLKNS